MGVTHTLAANWPINNHAGFSWSGTRSHLRNLLSGPTFCHTFSTAWQHRRWRFHTCSPEALLMGCWYMPDSCFILSACQSSSVMQYSLYISICPCWFYSDSHNHSSMTKWLLCYCNDCMVKIKRIRWYSFFFSRDLKVWWVRNIQLIL